MDVPVLYPYLPSMYSAKPGTRHEMAVLFQKVKKIEIAGSEEGGGEGGTYTHASP